MKFFPIFLPFFPPAGDFYGFSAVALARFALIRRWRAKLLAVFLPPRGKAFGAVRSVVWCLVAMEIPPAGAPPGGGVRLCGNGWWERVIFGGRCRFAQDDTGDAGAWDEKQSAVSVRKMKCRNGQGK